MTFILTCEMEEETRGKVGVVERENLAPRWVAWREGSLMERCGYGETEEEAKRDLLDKERESEGTRP